MAGLWWHDQPVMRSTPAAELHSVRASASFPLVPYSNRIGYGQFEWEGRKQAVHLNFAPEPHAIHGVGWDKPWTLQAHTDTMVRMALEHRGDSAWPFAFDCFQTIELGDGTVSLEMEVIHRGDAPAPYGLGWHPYFVKRAGATVRFNAEGRWEMGADKLPTHRAAHTGLHQNIDTLTVDHCFDGWDGTLVLQDARMRVTVRSALRHLVVFTTPERDNIAVEPVSHVNNALNLMASTGVSAQSLGLQVLQPGQRWACSMHIEVGDSV
jgi:aldose 1-epimerase